MGHSVLGWCEVALAKNVYFFKLILVVVTDLSNPTLTILVVACVTFYEFHAKEITERKKFQKNT